MVEQVVGRGELHAPSTSHVGCCSRPVVAMLELDDAGHLQDVAVATMASAAPAALHGVMAKMGEDGLEKEVAWVVGLCLLYHWREGPGLPREDKGGHACCLGRRILGPNLAQGWVESDASVRLRRTAGVCHNRQLIRSDQVGCVMRYGVDIFLLSSWEPQEEAMMNISARFSLS
jgi:hypothetical protein